MGPIQNAGMLGSQKQPDGDARNDEATKCGLGAVAVDGPDREDEEAGDSYIRGDERGVREDVGIKDNEDEREETCGIAEPLACGEKNGEAETEGE